MLLAHHRALDQTSGLIDLRRRLNRSGPYARAGGPVSSTRSHETSLSDLMVQSGCFPPLQAPASITSAEHKLLRALLVAYPMCEQKAVVNEESFYPFMSIQEVTDYVAQQLSVSHFSVMCAARDAIESVRWYRVAATPGEMDWLVQSVLDLPQFKGVPVVD